MLKKLMLATVAAALALPFGGILIDVGAANAGIYPTRDGIMLSD